MSFVAESPLTGPGAGGFMLVHTGGGEDHLLDFFVAAPGRGLERPGARPRSRRSTCTSPRTPCSASTSGPPRWARYGTTLGLAQALERFGSCLAGRPHGPARRRRSRGYRGGADAGLPVHRARADLPATPECSELYAPGGRLLVEGDLCASPSSAICSIAWAPRAGLPLRGRRGGRGERARVLERGGLLTRADLAEYEVIEREPARVTLPRPRGPDQSAALLGRDPDRRRARDPRTDRAPAPTRA